MRSGTKFWTAKEDDLLRKLIAAGWQHRAIGQVFGRSKQAVTARWSLLRRGLSSRAWSASEDALVRDTASYRTAADIGKEIGRTAAAVSDRASVLGVRWTGRDNRRMHTGFTATQVARLLGIPCSKTVTDWIEKGYLPATRRAHRLEARRRTQAYRVMPDALRDFLGAYPWLYQRERIADRGWAAYVARNVPNEDWIGTREAAGLLFLTVEGVALAIRKGDLRAEKVGPNWVIPMSSIRAYVPPPMGAACRNDQTAWQAVQARRAANLAARKSVTYTLRPETVALAEASRAARRAGKVAA